jgi:hypothetical protein
MKYFQLFASLFLCMSLSMQVGAVSICPYPQHEISFGMGGLSSYQMGLLYSDRLAADLVKGIAKSDSVSNKLKPAGPFFLTYKFFYKEKLSVGVSIVYSHNKVTSTFADNNIRETNYQTLALMPRMDFYYVRKPKFAMYGMLAGGVNAHFLKNITDNVTDKQVGVAYQVSPLCFRFGHKVGVVLELGFGTLGLVDAGISYRHYKRSWN